MIALNGNYILFLRLGRSQEIKVGSLGKVPFKKGTYVYVGSAMNGLRPRVARHFSKSKKIHWHIDYLLEKARPQFAAVFSPPEVAECELASFVSSLPDSSIVAGFGCSDCKCPSHLFFISEASIKRILDRFDAKMIWHPGELK